MYEEFKNTGRTPGKILYQLFEIGVPYKVVSQVQIHPNGTISLHFNKFATYVWNEHDTPVFTFVDAHERFMALRQPKIFAVWVTYDKAVGEYQISHWFTDQLPDRITNWPKKFGIPPQDWYIADADGLVYKSDFTPAKPVTPTDLMALKLKDALGSVHKRKK